MINQTTGRDEIEAMNDQYQEVLNWEEQFAEEIAQLKAADAVALAKKNKRITYAQKNEGARYIATQTGWKNLSKIYRIWDRQEQKHIGTTYTSRRACQNIIDNMGKDED